MTLTYLSCVTVETTNEAGAHIGMDGIVVVIFIIVPVECQCLRESPTIGAWLRGDQIEVSDATVGRGHGKADHLRFVEDKSF